MSEEDIHTVFNQYGRVASVRLLLTELPSRTSRFCLSLYELTEAEWLVGNVSRNIPVGLNAAVIINFAMVVHLEYGHLTAGSRAKCGGQGGRNVGYRKA